MVFAISYSIDEGFAGAESPQDALGSKSSVSGDEDPARLGVARSLPGLCRIADDDSEESAGMLGTISSCMGSASDSGAINGQVGEQNRHLIGFGVWIKGRDDLTR